MTVAFSPLHLAQLLLALQLLFSGKTLAFDGTNLRIDRSNYDRSQLDLVGAEVASKSEFPFFALFANGECGGALISESIVLTAASCVQSGHPATVRIGATNRTNGKEVKVRCAKSHPLYVWPKYQYDIAVIKLEEPITHITEFPILNPFTDYPSVSGQNLTVVGMGRNATAGYTAKTLMKLDYGYVTDEECKAMYQDKVSLGLHICAAGFREGTCFGDAGGPLFDNIEPRFLVGVVTGAEGGCADNQAADIYANVAAFTDWIQSQSDDPTCDQDCVGCLCEAYEKVSSFGYRVSYTVSSFFNL